MLVEKESALQVMSALSQPTRFEVFSKLVATLPDGMSAGDISGSLGTTPSAMSAHLAILTRAGLVTSAKSGRTVTYKASPGIVSDLDGFLMETIGSKR